uniref:Uncharacterized protein n=1 Tax=Anguilla anguilla TaxID=7936 RepID=A0A0E9REZ1_ANGAN
MDTCASSIRQSGLQSAPPAGLRQAHRDCSKQGNITSPSGCDRLLQR